MSEHNQNNNGYDNEPPLELEPTAEINEDTPTPRLHNDSESNHNGSHQNYHNGSHQNQSNSHYGSQNGSQNGFHNASNQNSHQGSHHSSHRGSSKKRSDSTHSNSGSYHTGHSNTGSNSTLQMNSQTNYSNTNSQTKFYSSGGNSQGGNSQFQNSNANQSSGHTNNHTNNHSNNTNQKSMSRSNSTSNTRSNAHQSSGHANSGSRSSSKHRSNSNGGGNGNGGNSNGGNGNSRRRSDSTMSNASQNQSPKMNPNLNSSIGCEGFNSSGSYQQPREHSYDENGHPYDEHEDNLDDYENIQLPEADYDPVQLDETAPPPSPPLGDKTKSGNYKVVKPIGTGASGQVFLVLHVHERRKYVMKQILLEHLAPKDRENTEQEVSLLSGLSHPNITKFKESFVDEKGVLCIVMEYCEHGDIYTYRKKINGKLPENRLIEWTIQIVLAVHELHRRGILHRDLKTQNIFLSGAGSGAGPSQYILKLGDFGVAKALDASCDMARTVVGTPMYMSPEIFRNKPYSYKSDVWGLGCVLFELVHGHHAFEAKSLNGLCVKVLKGRHAPLSKHLSNDLRELIQACLHPEPAKRPTLVEMLNIPFVRRRIPTVVRFMLKAGQEIGKEVVQQLCEMELQDCVDPKLRVPISKEELARRKSRAERAEMRRSQEEARLEGLQARALLLEAALPDTELDTITEAQEPVVSRPVTRTDRQSFGSKHPSNESFDSRPSPTNYHENSYDNDSRAYRDNSYRDTRNDNRQRDSRDGFYDERGNNYNNNHSNPNTFYDEPPQQKKRERRSRGFHNDNMPPVQPPNGGIMKKDASRESLTTVSRHGNAYSNTNSQANSNNNSGVIQLQPSRSSKDLTDTQQSLRFDVSQNRYYHSPSPTNGDLSNGHQIGQLHPQESPTSQMPDMSNGHEIGEMSSSMHMSRRDWVLQRKQKAKDEARLRFEREAKLIRQESLVEHRRTREMAKSWYQASQQVTDAVGGPLNKLPSIQSPATELPWRSSAANRRNNAHQFTREEQLKLMACTDGSRGSRNSRGSGGRFTPGSNNGRLPHDGRMHSNNRGARSMAQLSDPWQERSRDGTYGIAHSRSPQENTFYDQPPSYEHSPQVPQQQSQHQSQYQQQFTNQGSHHQQNNQQQFNQQSNQPSHQQHQAQHQSQQQQQFGRPGTRGTRGRGSFPEQNNAHQNQQQGYHNASHQQGHQSNPHQIQNPQQGYQNGANHDANQHYQSNPHPHQSNPQFHSDEERNNNSNFNQYSRQQERRHSHQADSPPPPMQSRQPAPIPPSGIPTPGRNAAGRGVMDNCRQSNSHVRSSSQHSGGSNQGHQGSNQGGRVSFPVDEKQQYNNYGHQSSPNMIPKTNSSPNMIPSAKNQRNNTGPPPLQEMSNGLSNSPKARGEGGRPPLPNQQRSPKGQMSPHHSPPLDAARDSRPISRNRTHKRTGGARREREHLSRKSTNDGYASTGNLTANTNSGYNSGYGGEQVNKSGYGSPKNQARQKELTNLKKQISDSKAAIYKHSITAEAARAPLNSGEQALTAETAEQQAAERRRQRAARKERERQQQHGEHSTSPRSPQRDDMFHVPARPRRTRDDDQHAAPYSSANYGERQPRVSRHARPPPVATSPSPPPLHHQSGHGSPNYGSPVYSPIQQL